MPKYGDVSDKNRKYFKHVKKGPFAPAEFDVNDHVRVLTDGPYVLETGRIIMRTLNADDQPLYHVLFDHDLAARPTAYLTHELELVGYSVQQYIEEEVPERE